MNRIENDYLRVLGSTFDVQMILKGSGVGNTDLRSQRLQLGGRTMEFLRVLQLKIRDRKL